MASHSVEAATRKRTLRARPERLNKHQQKTQATKLRLLKAALRIFTRDGFEAARIDDIAAAAGHTRGAFYAHFSTKEELFLALIEQESSRHGKVVGAMLRKCKTEKERMDSLREYYASLLADKKWAILVIEFKLYALRHGNLRARLADAHRQVRTIGKPEVERLLPAALEQPAALREVKRITLEALLTGLSLESAYDPKRVSEDTAESILRQAFDMAQKFSA